MNNHQDQPLTFHKCFDGLLDTFRNVIGSMTWLKVSAEEAKKFYISYPYLIELDCSVTSQKIKVDKSILELIQKEGFNQKTPLFSKTLINFYRVFTIAIQDIISEEQDFQPFLQKDELQFFRHLRNASAHSNKFFWGKGERRKRTIKKLPVSWRNKIIVEKMEENSLYMDFIGPGDIFVLLADISLLVGRGNLIAGAQHNPPDSRAK